MFKSIITAAVIATAAFTTSASANSYTVCIDGGRVLESVANARDNGLSAADAYRIMEEVGLDSDLAVNILEVVYITRRTETPEALKEWFVINCLGELT